MARGEGSVRTGEAKEIEGRGGDATNWDEESYRRSILSHRSLSYRTVFRTAFPPSLNPNPSTSPETLVAACSDGSIACYSLASCIAASSQTLTLPHPTHSSDSGTHSDHELINEHPLVDPLCIIKGHEGPAYDLKFYGHGENTLLFSCGDDGRIRAWRWIDILQCNVPLSMQGNHLSPIFDVANQQNEGPWGARAPIPENNAIAVNYEDGCIYSAAGDGCAYCFDVETSKCKTVFRGHSDYLHTVAVRKLNNQIITGSEDGTARLWDCRSAKCTQIIHPEKNLDLKENVWISSVAVDSSENWLACGSGRGISVWSLVSKECIFNIECATPVQDLLFHNNHVLAVGSELVLSRFAINGALLSQIKCAPLSAFSVSLHPSGVVAVGGSGGLVDIISGFGSHLCTFACSGIA